jgi:O-antigen/teichoic acid export membrane protein
MFRERKPIGGFSRRDAGVVERRTLALMAYRGASDAAAKAVMFAITVAAARQLTREAFGLFAVASTLGWLGSVAADFGIQMHLAREVSLSHTNASALLRRWLPVRVATGAFAGAMSLLVIIWLEREGEALVPMMLLTLTYGVTGLTECLYYFFRGIERSDLESTLTVVQRGSTGVLALGVLAWRPGLLPLSVAMLVPSIVTLAAAATLTGRLAGRLSAPLQVPRVRPDEFLNNVAPIGLGIVLSAFYFRVDVFLLERWTGTGAVALYNAVYRVIDALRLFPAAVLAVALPALCRARDTRLLRRVSAPLTAAAVGAAAVLWLTAPMLVPAIYGDGYRDAAAAFRILTIALPLMTLNYALTHQLVGWHRHGVYAGVCAGALAWNVALNWLLIPSYGAEGAAWSTVWTEAFVMIGCLAAFAAPRPAVIAPDAAVAPGSGGPR